MNGGLCLEERGGISAGEDGQEVHAGLGSAEVSVLDRAGQSLSFLIRKNREFNSKINSKSKEIKGNQRKSS